MADAIPPSDPDRRQLDQEEAVGISVYVRTDTSGFKCILKQRYTDFLVNEILPSGQTLHLTQEPRDQERKRKRGDDGEVSRKKVHINGQSETAAESKANGSESNGAAVEGAIKGAAVPDATPVASTPSEVKPSASSASIQAIKDEATASISAEDISTLNETLGNESTPLIIDLYASVIAHPDRKPRDHPTVNSPPIAEKSKRTEAHLSVRRIFQSKLETLTIQDGDHQSGPGTIISVKAAPTKAPSNPNNDGRNGENQRGKQNWSELGGEYLHFTLYKENKDTMEVLYFLASQLKMHMKHFGFAGTKDRRGVTVQRVSIHRVKRERIEALNKLARGWRLGGPWEYKNEGLDLGMLKGNEFLLTLRDARFNSETDDADFEARLKRARAVVEAAARGVNETGFLNYYGLQRFGTHSTGTHAIGMKMLKGDLKGAVDSILSYDPALLEEQPSEPGANDQANGDSASAKKIPQDDINRAKAIDSFRQTGISNDALKHLPGSRFSAEKGIITHLGKKDRKTGKNPNENDFQGALNMIQRNLRLMYVHAYQSFVWNTIAGKRWEKFGNRVIQGDLVVVGEKEREEGVTNGTVTSIQEVDEHGEPIIHPSASDDQGAAPAPGEIDDPYVRARPLSKEEAESGRFNILDLVLPLPGFDVIYPENDIGKLYEEYMASEEGGGLDPYNMRRSWKDISLSGGYRKMMARPLSPIEVDVMAYGGPEEQMVETDLERLQNGDRSEAPVNDESAPAKDKVAVILKLQLGSSQYATMALRELTKGGAVGFTPSYSVSNR